MCASRFDSKVISEAQSVVNSLIDSDDFSALSFRARLRVALFARCGFVLSRLHDQNLLDGLVNRICQIQSQTSDLFVP